MFCGRDHSTGSRGNLLVKFRRHQSGWLEKLREREQVFLADDDITKTAFQWETLTSQTMTSYHYFRQSTPFEDQRRFWRVIEAQRGFLCTSKPGREYTVRSDFSNHWRWLGKEGEHYIYIIQYFLFWLPKILKRIKELSSTNSVIWSNVLSNTKNKLL